MAAGDPADVGQTIYVMRLVRRARGSSSADGCYLVRWDPNWARGPGMDAALLLTTRNPEKAQRFACVADALEVYLAPTWQTVEDLPLTEWEIEVLPLRTAVIEEGNRG